MAPTIAAPRRFGLGEGAGHPVRVTPGSRTVGRRFDAGAEPHPPSGWTGQPPGGGPPAPGPPTPDRVRPLTPVVVDRRLNPVLLGSAVVGSASTTT